MVMSKRGIIFSLIAIGLAGLFILLFSSGFTGQLDDQSQVVRTRINDLDNTIDDFYSYAAAAQEVAGRSALEALYDHINTTGSFLGDFKNSLTRCLNDSDGCSNADDLQGQLDDYATALKKTKDADLEATATEVQVLSESYWSIRVQSEITITLSDRFATWHYAQNVTSRIPTTGTFDPEFIRLSQLYGDGTKTERAIATSPFDKQRQTINRTTFMDFYTVGQYQYSLNGSCLSQRYEGDFTDPPAGSRCGIETILDPEDFPGLTDQDITHMDWEAVRGLKHPCSERYYITEVDPDLRLWENDTFDYGQFPPYSTHC